MVNAWTNTPTYIAARIAQKDLETSDPAALKKVLDMLKPIADLTKSGDYPFMDAAVYTMEASRAGFSLNDNWTYQFTPLFDGVPQKEFEQHPDFDLLTTIGKSQTTVDSNGPSRIDKAFGKALSLMYIFNQVTQVHQPMRNIIRFSSAHPNGDEFGKLHKIDDTDYSNLFDLFEDAFGQYRALQYPLSSTTTLDKYVAEIVDSYPKSTFTKEIEDINKANWSKQSYNIGKGFAYTLVEGDEPSHEYLQNGEDIVNKQLALAGYRLSALISYMMSKQTETNTVVEQMLKDILS